jgi:indolepyruvate ferredoxin oxidoreductase
LHSNPAFLAQLDAQFEHGYSVKYNLAPPMLSKRDPATGELTKQQYGSWMGTAFKWLARFKGLRGSALDIFGKTDERRHERQLIEDYVALLDQIVAGLNAVNYDAAVALASVPDEIRGYDVVKARSVEAATLLQAQRLQAFREPVAAKLAA